MQRATRRNDGAKLLLLAKRRRSDTRDQCRSVGRAQQACRRVGDMASKEDSH